MLNKKMSSPKFDRILRGRRTDLLIVVEILLFGFIIFVKLFRPGLVAFEDNPPHFIEAWSLTNYIIPYKLDFSAWVNYDFAGFPIFMYHPYLLGFFSIYVLQLIPGVSLSLAYKLIMYLSYVLPAVCLFLVMRRKVGVDFAIIPAALWLFNLYALDMIVQGMWSISLSIAPFILLINELYILDREDYSNKYPLWSILKIAILLAGILLIHSYTFFVSMIIIGLFILFLIISYLFKFRQNYSSLSVNQLHYSSKIITSLIIAVVLAVIIDGFYVIKLLKTSDWPSSVFSGGSFFGGIISIIFPYHLGLRAIYDLVLEHNYMDALIIFFKQLLTNAPNYFLLVFGISGVLYNKDKLFSKVILLVLAILILAITGLFNFVYGLPIIQFLKMSRLLIHVEAILLFFVSTGFYQIILNKQKILQYHSTEKSYTYIRKSVFSRILIAIVIVLFIASEGMAFFEEEKNMYLTQDYPEFNNILDVFNWIEINVNDPTRVYYQSTFNDSYRSGIDRSWIMAYANYYTTKPSLGTWSGQMPYPTYKNLTTYIEGGEVIFGRPINDITDEKLAFYLKIYNSKYIVINSNSMRKLLDNSSLFDKKVSFGRFSIYSLKNYEPNYIQTPDTNSSITNIKFENELIEFDILNAESVNISVQYHPYWKAYIDGKSVKITKSDFNLMQLAIPPEHNKIHHVIMRFENKIID